MISAKIAKNYKTDIFIFDIYDIFDNMKYQKYPFFIFSKMSR